MYKEEVELDEAKLNIKKIHKAVDDGKSMDVIVGMFADKRTTNTDEIRKIVKDYKFKKRMKEEVELDESVIDKVKEIASKKKAMKIDGVMVDSFTASAISQIYDKVNDANKKKMEKLPITNLANLAFKMMQKNEYVPEEVELDEALPSHLKKFFDKDGNPKSKEGKAAWERLAKMKGFKKYTSKQVKMAIGIAFDKRYVQGNMTGAVNAIEKIAKGLSEIEPVANALRRANENTILGRIDAKLKERKNG
jgi:ribosomal protein S8E